MAKISYSSSGVSYDLMDPFKKLAQQAAIETVRAVDPENSVYMETSMGESSSLFKISENLTLAFVVEGLGTKNLVADKMYQLTNKSYYDQIAKDTIAAIVNDLITIGAKPQIINAYFAMGSSDWLEDSQKSVDLINGWRDACIECGAIYGGGETPTLKGIINEEKIDLAGSAIGIINHKPIFGKSLQAGDAIILIESNGIHTNGLTLARKIADILPKGYLTKLSNGDTYGNSLLRPSHIYAKAVNDLLDKNIDIHYMVNITGHGWRKLMRAKKDLSYVIEKLPEQDPLFTFIKEKSGSSDEDMYGTFNMGAGFAVILPSDQAEKAIEIIKENGFKSWIAGKVEEGEKRVYIKPLNITFKSDSLNIR